MLFAAVEKKLDVKLKEADVRCLVAWLRGEFSVFLALFQIRKNRFGDGNYCSFQKKRNKFQLFQNENNK